MAIAIETNYSSPWADKVKDYLKDTSTFAIAVPIAASDLGACVTATKEEKKEPMAENEEDRDLHLSFFY